MSLSLSISESNVSKEDNTSKITATLKISSSSSWNYDSRSGYIQIDGTKYSFSHSFSTGTTTLATKSKTVTHDSDGGGTITVKGYYSTGVSLGNLSTSKTYTLTQIDRTYTIKFNSNTTDTVSNMPSSQTKTYGKTLTLSSKVPTRTGYTFKEWNTSKSGTGTSYKPGGSYKTNAADTLYAIWTENTYNVTYTLPSGYATFTSNSSTSITVTYKYTQTNGVVPAVSVNAGYSFKGFLVNGVRYLPGNTIKGSVGAVSFTTVAATSSDFTRLTTTLTFQGSGISPFTMTQDAGTSFRMPTYTGTLTEAYEFKYWTSSTYNIYYAGNSYVFSSNTTLTAYIAKKSDEIFRYYVPTTIESSSQRTSLFLTNFASIGSSYTIPSNSPDNKVENGTYQFKYWTTTLNKKFVGATYNYVIPKILLDAIENGFSGNYNSEYNLYKAGWIDSSVSEGDGKTFYAVYVDTTKSSIKDSGSNFAYIDIEKDTTGSGAQEVQKDYSEYILNNVEDDDIVLHSNKFVAYAKYTLPSEEMKLNIDHLSIVGSNTSDQIAATTTLITVGLESYIFFSGAIDSQAIQIETTTITISGVRDILGRDVDDVSFSIKPPKIIRDISPTGDIVSLFNQNYTKLSVNNELQIDGDIRLFDSNIYIGENGDELIESATELGKVIRKYETQASSGSTPAEYGALTGYVGNSIGTLVSSANATFDVVSLTWNSNTPTVNNSLLQVGLNSNNRPCLTLGDRKSNTLIGDYSVSIGDYNSAVSKYSTAIGYYNKSGDATSTSTLNSSYYATTIGYYNTASSTGAVAMGYYNTASGESSVAMGYSSGAYKDYSIAIGYSNSAWGTYSTAIGYGARCDNDNIGQFACGKYNKYDNTYTVDSSTYNPLFMVGNGASSTSRSNALMLTTAGHLLLAGHSSHIGHVEYANDTVALSSAASWSDITYVTLTPGSWVINVESYCGTLASGKRLATRLRIEGSNASAFNTEYSSIRSIIHTSNSAGASAFACGGVELDSTCPTYKAYVQGYQTQGAQQDVTGYIRAIRIA